jgi:hypothetical protein
MQEGCIRVASPKFKFDISEKGDGFIQSIQYLTDLFPHIIFTLPATARTPLPPDNQFPSGNGPFPRWE